MDGFAERQVVSEQCGTGNAGPTVHQIDEGIQQELAASRSSRSRMLRVLLSGVDARHAKDHASS